MSLIELTKRNIHRNLGAYLVYFYPMVFSVVIYFTFVSLQYNRNIINAAASLGKIGPAFMAASVFLMVFSALFILYSNSFFMKKRKKEIALYSLYGMSKKVIGKMLFYENMLVGAIALLVGIGLGAVLSKLFAMVLVKLMGVPIVAGFAFSAGAAFQTIVVFILIISAASIYNARVIRVSTLLELFQAGKKAEKKPRASVGVAILSLLFIGTGYWVVLQPVSSSLWTNHAWLKILGALACLIIGTYLFIRAFIVYILSALSKRKAFFYKGPNMISTSNLLFRIKGNIIVLSVLALLSTFTLFLMGVTWSLYANLNDISKENFPHSFIYTVQNEEAETEIARLFEAREDILYSQKIEPVKIEAGPDFSGRFPPEYPILLIPESSFRQLAGKMGKDADLDFAGNEAIAFYDGNLNRTHDPYNGRKIGLPGGETVKFASYEGYSLLNQAIFAFPVVIKDAVYKKAVGSGAHTTQLQIYKLGKEKDTKELGENIEEILWEHAEDRNELIWSSFYKEYAQGMETYGILIFISGFLGLVFLMATGSVLFYRQLSEAAADRPRYQILRKIGFDTREMKKSIRVQTLFVFSIPILLAVSHSSILISALAGFAGIRMAGPFMVVIGLYIGLYLAYFNYTSARFFTLVNE
ncbi:ABC transporter permease [Bacillus sp. FJAT-27245]|uniref:ABC transporter permease n=1 Tax=Bacillus sp. FJAT-27245 TaxID=1684144 RepID=UPI0006A796EC|nr:ABC transporter permease [Bacillus sp. FJAT-27245]